MKKDFSPLWPSRQPNNFSELGRTPAVPSVIVAHDHLVESLNTFKAHTGLPHTQQEQLEAVIAKDAQDLVVQIVPPQVAEVLTLENPRPSEPVAPTLNDTYLLANALDTTGDPKVHDALGYILECEPPLFSDILKMAYDMSEITGDPLMVEHHRLMELEASEMDLYIQNWALARYAKKQAEKQKTS